MLAPIRALDRYGDLDLACVAALNEIVARSGAQVVVSSSLRYGKSIAELQAMLAAVGFIGEVVDKTPTDLGGCDRGEEIAAWLRAHPATSWVIIDDHRDVGPLVGRLVQTTATRGLCLADVERAMAALAISDPMDYN